MEFVRLVDYVKQGDLFEKIFGCYDQIVSDFDFSGSVGNFIKIDKYNDFKHIELNKKTLFILDKILVDNIFDLIQDIDKYSIIDMNFGLMGCGKKIGFSKKKFDDFVNLGINIFEPFDLSSFLFELSGNDGKKYFRINSMSLPTDISYGKSKDVISLEGFGFDGGNFSIVSTGSMLSEIVRFGNLMQEQGLNLNIFLINKLSAIEKYHFGNKKNLVLLFDSKDFGYDKYFERVFGLNNLKFIYPEYNRISTVFDEYLLESSKFNAENMYDRLMKY